MSIIFCDFFEIIFYLFYLGDFSLTARRFFGIIINIISVSSYKGDIYVKRNITI